MKTFTINGSLVYFDETLEYADFYIKDDEPQSLSINWDAFLTALESGEVVWGESLIRELKLMSRWIHEAPRKRHYRQKILEGYTVVSTEFFFEGEGGDKFIDALERTGELAGLVLQLHGINPVGPIQQDDPSRPTTVEECLGE